MVIINFIGLHLIKLFSLVIVQKLVMKVMLIHIQLDIRL